MEAVALGAGRLPSKSYSVAIKGAIVPFYLTINQIKCWPLDQNRENTRKNAHYNSNSRNQDTSKQITGISQKKSKA